MQYAVCSHGTLAYFPHRYPFMHLGGEEQLWDKFLAQGNFSGQGGIRTRDLSIPEPASCH
ncbi:hypothetical protein DPMN_148373 [Dreissena polymorpha]|uniref:Uncharacterized protein n=1 Tax=Dreissena polymorpha TaxID=45954 RepID=A0A9D4FDW2_DREPO|nr:hypothetical protein DPMN_148373 [Dreissena polymorpha]